MFVPKWLTVPSSLVPLLIGIASRVAGRIAESAQVDDRREEESTSNDCYEMRGGADYRNLLSRSVNPVEISSRAVSGSSQQASDHYGWTDRRRSGNSWDGRRGANCVVRPTMSLSFGRINTNGGKLNMTLRARCTKLPTHFCHTEKSHRRAFGRILRGRLWKWSACRRPQEASVLSVVSDL